MFKRRITFFFVCIGLANSVLLFAQPNSITIQNGILSAVFKPQSKTIEVKDIASGKIFLKKGLTENVAGAVLEQVADSVFGNGRALRLNKTGGGYYTFALYPKISFLFIKETVVNSSAEHKTLQKVKSFSFLVDLQQPLHRIKTLGTGGLLSPKANPGSYVFLTTVDTATREGVVTGWLTNERGSGVIFSDTNDNMVKIEPQIDYGRLLIPAKSSVGLETLLVGYFKDARLGEENFASLIARKQHIQLPPRKAVYCTWYSDKNGGAGNETSTSELSNFIVRKLKPYGLGVIQIDDQWQDGGLYNGPARGFERANPKGPYPNGMTVAAQAIKKRYICSQDTS